MSLSETTKQLNINVDPKVLEFCQKGIEQMSKSIDPIHDDTHVRRILELLGKFLKENESIEIDLNVVLISICWHDVWRSTYYKDNFLYIVYQFIFEGRKAANLTRRVMKEMGFDTKTINYVHYCVRKHSTLQFRGIKTYEAKLLKDLDSLDAWSEERMELIIEFFSRKILKNKSLKKIFKWAYTKYIRSKNYFFDFSKRESDARFDTLELNITRHLSA